MDPPRPVPTPLPAGRVAFRFEGADHGAAVSFYVSRPGPGQGPVLHRHPYEETFILEEGRAEFTVDGDTVEVEAGHALVVPAGAAHRFVNSGDVPLRMVSIHPAERMVQEDLPG